MNGRLVASEAVGTGAVALACATIVPLFIDVQTATSLAVYALLALSLGFIWGFGGILCFGQAAFFGLGAYAYALAALNFDGPWMAFLVAIIVPALFAAGIGALMFYGRLSDVYLAVVTLVVTLILFKFFNSTAGPQYQVGTARLGGFNGIPGFPTLTVPGDPDVDIDGAYLFYLAIALLALVYLVLRWTLRSPFGRVVVALRENEERVELLGYDVRLHKTIVFAIGGGVAGLAGCLFANWAEIVTPGLYSLGQSAEIIIWVIVGGLGTLIGPMLGAALLGYLKFALGHQSVVDNSFLMGVLLVLVVLFVPEGILLTLARLFVSWMGRRARAPRSGRRRRQSTDAR
jgi:branched-chain amino acid transport system permease protein